MILIKQKLQEVNSMKEKNDMLKKTIEKVKDESKNREELLKREIDKLEKERDTLFEKHLKVESSIQSASMVGWMFFCVVINFMLQFFSLHFHCFILLSSFHVLE